MYANKKFKDAVTMLSPQVSMRLTFDNPSEVIDASNYLLNATVDFISNSLFGEVPTTQLKATFLYNKKISYLQRKCYVEVCAMDADRTTENWIPFGYFFVAENGQETNEIDGTVSITAYDTSSRLDIDYVKLPFPLTGKQVMQSIASRNGLNISKLSSELLLDKFTFKGTSLSDSYIMTDREIMMQYLKINMASAYVDRFGELRIYTVFDKKTGVDSIEFGYDAVELKLEPLFGPVNALVYGSRIDDKDDNWKYITDKDQASIEKNGMTPIRFYENIFIDTLKDAEQEKIIADLFKIIKGYSFTPFDINMFARPDLDAGDVVSLTSKADGTFLVPITNQTYEYNGGMMATLKTKEMVESITNYEKGYLNTKIESLQKGVAGAIDSANGKNKNYYGAFEPEKPKEGDTWFKTVDGETQIYVYVRNPDGTFDWVRADPDVNEIKEQVNKAEKDAEKALNDANDAVNKANQNVLAIDETNKHLGDVEKDATQAMLNSKQAILDAQKVADSQKALDTKVTTEVNRIDGVLATTVKQTEFNKLNGRVNTAETNINQNSKDITLRATKTEVNLIDKKVNQVDSQLKLEAGKITTLTSKTDGQATQITRLEQNYTGLNSTVANVKQELTDLEIGTRNYLLDSNNPVSYVGTGNTNSGIKLYRFSVGSIQNLPYKDNEDWEVSYDYEIKGSNFGGTFKIQYNGTPWAGGLGDLPVIQASSSRKGSVKGIIHSTDVWKTGTATGISLRADNIPKTVTIIIKNMKFARGNKITDWTPAPEDFVTTTEYSVLDQKVNSIQTTVGTKANQSQVTQLDNQITSVVKDVNSLELGNLLMDTEGMQSFSGRNVSNQSSTVYPFSLQKIQEVAKVVDNVAISFKWSVKGKASGTFKPQFNQGPWNIGGAPTVTISESNKSGTYFYTMNKVDSWSSSASLATGVSIRFDNIPIGTTIEISELYFVRGNKHTSWKVANNDVASQSQITQLTDNINLRVQKADVINQINISPESILIAGKKIQITGDTYISNGIIKNAMLENATITGAKIANATITDAKISNLNVNKLSGNISYFLQSNWDSLSGKKVRIEGDGLTTYLGGKKTSLLDGSGQKFYKDNRLLGNIGIYTRGNGKDTGIVFDMEEYEGNFMGWVAPDKTSSTGKTFKMLFKDNILFFDRFGPLNTQNSHIRCFGGGVGNEEGVFLMNENWSSGIFISKSNRGVAVTLPEGGMRWLS